MYRFFTKSIVQQVQIVNVKGIDYSDSPRNKSGLEDRFVFEDTATEKRIQHLNKPL
jgi:hypothetical protein